MNNLKTAFKKFVPVFIGFSIVCAVLFGLLYLLDNKKDNDQILLDRIATIQKEYDELWLTKGKELMHQKQSLFQQQEDVEKKLAQYSQEIQKMRDVVSNKTRLKVWEPANEKFYNDNKDTAKYRIIKEGIGGAEIATGSGYIFEYRDPFDLFYTCHKLDKCYETQSDTEHVKNNGYIATDIGTGGKNVPVRLPDYMGKEVVYTLKYVTYPRTTGKTVEAFGEVDGVKFMWRIGHVHWNFNDKNYESLYHNKQLKTGTVIAYSGGEIEKSFKNGGDQGATTGEHLHIEYLIWDGAKYMPTFYRITSKFNKHVEGEIVSQVTQTVEEQKDDLVNGMPNMATHTISDVSPYLKDKAQPHGKKEPEVKTNNLVNTGDAMFPRVVFVTSFNPQTSQTDGDPYVGAAGTKMKEGDIALSRDLLYPNSNLNTGYNKGSPVKYGDKVRLHSLIPQCNGEFTVTDTMNKRFKNRGDLFYFDKKKNTSCWGIVEKVQ